jgi:hypothetical protein
MIRTKRRREGAFRQWLGLCLVLLLAFAPPLNLAGVDLALQVQGEIAAHHAHGQEGQDVSGHDHSGHGHSGPDHSGLAHHTSANGCLQCLALGGMSLAGAATAPDPAPQLHTIGTGWTYASLTWDSRGAKFRVCRGPPALA